MTTHARARRMPKQPRKLLSEQTDESSRACALGSAVVSGSCGVVCFCSGSANLVSAPVLLVPWSFKQVPVRARSGNHAVGWLCVCVCVCGRLEMADCVLRCTRVHAQRRRMSMHDTLAQMLQANDATLSFFPGLIFKGEGCADLTFGPLARLLFPQALESRATSAPPAQESCTRGLLSNRAVAHFILERRIFSSKWRAELKW